MPANLNKVFLMGNLTRDPEMRTLPSGTTVCAFGVAVNRQFVNAAGVTQEEVCFIDVSAFGRSGEVVAQYLRKGSPIFVEGRLHFEQWDERETGKKRNRLSVTAERIQLIGAPAGREGGYAEDEQADAASAPGGWQQPQQPQAPSGGWQRPQGGPPPQGGWQRQAPQRGPAAPQGGWSRQAPAAPQGNWQQPPPAANNQAPAAPQGNWQQPPPAANNQTPAAPQGNWQQPPPAAKSPAPAAPAAPAMPQFEPLPEEGGSGGDDLPF